ncbi:MAG: hypothetical protein FWE31_01415 [Firmicutes bacterium]|nr:hypothetical protein [Bacillota bacterium]
MKEILAYQEKEKEKLKLLESLESGKVKREIDAASKDLEAAKSSVLSLDNDAKSLVSSVDTIRKNLSELLTRADQMSATDFSKQSEDEINSAISYMGTLSGKIAGYERQLDETTKKINTKSKQFEDEKQKIMKAQKLVAGYTPQYEKAQADLEPKVKAIDKELATLGKAVDGKLLERYTKARSQVKSLKPVNIVVPIVGNQCGACMFEMPLSRIHTITKDGYVVCEECGKIIYKA